MESAKRSDLAPFFRDLSQSENLSEIKPPLVLSDDWSFIVYLYDES